MDHLTKLLIIDDDPEDQKLMHDAIQKSGLEINIHLACNGEEGIKKANELKPQDIVVLDTILPGIDGFETCKIIKDLEKKLKIIICTGRVDEVDAGKAMAAGADDYCVKTADSRPLIHAIRNLIAS